MIDFPALASGETPFWDGQTFQIGQRTSRVLAYSTNPTGWDETLTALHEAEAGDGAHPIDLASRHAAIDALRRHRFPEDGALLEIGCSSGFLLRDLKRAFPNAEIVGSDVFLELLERLGRSLPGLPLVQMDLLQCPIRGGQFDAVVALNVLEHIESDTTALLRMAELLKPEGILVLEVPQGPNLYDLYDAYLKHFRRYSKQEVVAKCSSSGFKPIEVKFLGFVPYIPFWLMKKLNRLRYGKRGERALRLQELVRGQIKTTADSKLLRLAFLVEKALCTRISAPIGIRCTLVARASDAGQVRWQTPRNSAGL